MRFGCCGCMVEPARDPIGVEIIERLAGFGFDYVELSLADIAALPEAEFERLAVRVERSGIGCEACNNFFPPHIRLTGPAAKPDVALSYAEAALRRAARLGVRIVVFGSSGAKNIPEGFSPAAAWVQVADLLRQMGPLAQSLGITLVVEPISRPEANFVNLAAEGLRMVREVAHTAVQLLVDYYHLCMEGEDPSILVEAEGAVRHLHFAGIEGRRFPVKPEDAGSEFFGYLQRIGYGGRCSVEGYTDDFITDAPRALHLLRAQTERNVRWQS